MILFILGAALLAAAIGIIYAKNTPADITERTRPVSMQQTVLSNFLLLLIIAGGLMMAMAVF